MATKGGMVVDAQGNVYSTGFSYLDDSEYDWATIKYNTHGERQWVATYNGAGNSSDIANGITVDAQGDVYVTGYATEIPGSGAVSLTTIKYIGATGQQAWKQSYRAPVATDSAFGQSIALNPKQPNSVYVTGYVVRGASSTSGNDAVTLRYDTASGAQRWIALYNGPDNRDDGSVDLAVDASGNCYVTGFSVGTATNLDYLTIKYGATTGQAVWTRRYNGPGNNTDRPNALVLDVQGNVSVTGQSYGGDSVSFDYATVKYNGASGDPIWTKRYNNAAVNGTDIASAIAADSGGNIYVTGYSSGGNPATSGNTGNDYVTIKYDTDSGGEVWTARYDANYPSATLDRSDVANALTVDSVGNVFVTGYSYGGSPASGGTGNDVATVKYNRNGLQQWVRRYNSNDAGDSATNNNDNGQNIALDAQGAVYVGGILTSAATDSDLLTLKYNVGSVWSAQDIAVGNDNKTRFLWNRSDNAIALWTVTAPGVIEKSAVFGPYAGLTARAIAVGSDNKVRILWYGGPGKAVVWTVKADLSGVEAGYTFAATSYYPWEIAVGPTDNKTRISWYDANNRVAIWTLTGGVISQSVLFNQPSGGYIDQAIAVGADNRTRLLWNSQSLGKTALWTLNAATPSTIDAGYSYAQTGLFARDVAVGADNKPRLLWAYSTGAAALWQVSASSSAVEKGIALGPLPQPGWIPSRISFSGGSGSDKNVRLLWTAPTGAVILYTVNPLTGAVITTTPFGPL